LLVAEPTSRAAPLCTVLSASLALGKLRWWCAAWYKLFSTRELTLPGRPHLGTAVLLHLYRRTFKASPARRVPQHFYRCPKRSFSLLLPRIPESTACLPAFSHCCPLSSRLTTPHPCSRLGPANASLLFQYLVVAPWTCRKTNITTACSLLGGIF
jgi:hypothetical protein